MAKRKNNSLSRRVSTRKYRDVYWVSAEGRTEKDYLSMAVFRDLPAAGMTDVYKLIKSLLSDTPVTPE